MDAIDRIRAFNRAHTARIGLLDQSYLAAGLGLPEVRVLFELATGTGWTARQLAGVLQVNEGHLSRVIARLEADGLVGRRPAEDHRARILTLTETGRAQADEVQALSRAEIGDWFAHLPPRSDEAVAAALDEVEAVLNPPDAEAVELRDLAIGDAGWLIEQHGRLYARDEGFDETFEALVAEILAAYIRNRDPSVERAWIAWAGGRRLGSIFCVKGPEPGVAKLRLFLLLPEARGFGLGRRLLDTCIDHARERGFRRLVLWTHESHRAACALYKARGFALTDSRPTHSFGVDVVEQEWALDLAG
ncbi:GNAT family N-acetyltransferase [Rhodobacterales bacterium HKCCE3408]|nr:GNAT family N-acetyltransferase [Rhodobacterales bacterium HKCCE3408]